MTHLALNLEQKKKDDELEALIEFFVDNCTLLNIYTYTHTHHPIRGKYMGVILRKITRLDI